MIRIQGSQIAGTVPLTNFPVLVSYTHNNLRNTANGGNVQNANGFDILFTLGDCSTVIPYQRELYVANTGQIVAWLRVPVLTPGQDLTILMFYGRSGVTTDPSTTGVWDSDYLGVWHFNNSVADGTANANNLTNSSTSNLASSKIGQGRDLNNSSNVNSNNSGQHLRLPNNILSGVSNFSYEGWVMLDRTATNWERIFDFGPNTTTNFFFTPSTDVGAEAQTRARITTTGIGGEQGPIIANSGTQTGMWVHWAVTYDATAQLMRIYRNGALYGSATVTTLPSAMGNSGLHYFGRSKYSDDHYIDAKFDEFRLSRTARSAAYITTSYRNQNTPSSFYTMGNQMTALDLCLLALPIELADFRAEPHGHDAVQVRWTTVSEKDNDHFTVERSEDGEQWEEIASLPGAGNSQSTIHYDHLDRGPLPGISYYRLRQTDHDGTSTWSEPRSVERHGMGQDVVVFPNPASDAFLLKGPWDGPIVVLDHTGRIVAQGRSNEAVSVWELPAGHYRVQAVPGAEKPLNLPLLIAR